MTTHARTLLLVITLLSPVARAQSPETLPVTSGAPTPPPAPSAGAARTPEQPAAQEPAPAKSSARLDPDFPAGEADALTDRRVTFGAAIAPAALPAGAMATYAFLGVPELGLGFRQGFGPFELEGRAKLDYLKISSTLDLMARVRAWSADRVLLAPYFGLGVVYDAGVTYADPDNFSYLGARLLGGAVLSYGLSETVRAVAAAELPLDIGLSPLGAFRVTPLVGAGAEFYIGEDFTLGLLGQIGFDVRKDPVALARLGLGYHLRIALGYRLF